MLPHCHNGYLRNSLAACLFSTSSLHVQPNLPSVELRNPSWTFLTICIPHGRRADTLSPYSRPLYVGRLGRRITTTPCDRHVQSVNGSSIIFVVCITICVVVHIPLTKPDPDAMACVGPVRTMTMDVCVISSTAECIQTVQIPLVGRVDASQNGLPKRIVWKQSMQTIYANTTLQ
jgi:hypothetical protein